MTSSYQDRKTALNKSLKRVSQLKLVQDKIVQTILTIDHIVRNNKLEPQEKLKLIQIECDNLCGR